MAKPNKSVCELRASAGFPLAATIAAYTGIKASIKLLLRLIAAQVCERQSITCGTKTIDKNKAESNAIPLLA